jgi:hypothetical protein
VDIGEARTHVGNEIAPQEFYDILVVLAHAASAQVAENEKEGLP